jgi:glyoxylase-like metal-dependent hydrolase (beta-lactamase superfamily II)
VSERIIPLEDELGDVLEKAMRRTDLSEETLAARAGVPATKILDAIDYRPALTSGELRRLAAALNLNEVGLCALGCGQYPLPAARTLPFAIYPLRMAHGIGVANAYIVAGRRSSHGVLFDTGPDIDALEAVWPRAITELDAVFITHVETEHAGGLCEVVRRFGVTAACGPAGIQVSCGRPMGEGERRQFAAFDVTAFSTPGHASAHNCYLVRATGAKAGPALLISGDLVFAGSVGGAYFCHRQLALHLRRMLAAVGPSTIIAPGHGPLTTAENELRYNPFVL